MADVGLKELKVKQNLTLAEKVIRRALRNGIQQGSSRVNKAVTGIAKVRKITYETDRANFMVVLQADVADRDPQWPKDSRSDEFVSYVESIRKKMAMENKES